MPRLFLALAVAFTALAAQPLVADAHHAILPGEVEEVLGDAASPEPQPGDPMYTADDEHTPNMSLVGNLPYREGGDLAFQGTTVVAGAYGFPGGFRLIDASKPQEPTLTGVFDCPGPQNDVSVWESIVIVSVDSPRSSPSCGAGAASSADVAAGNEQKAWEGIRIVDTDKRVLDERGAPKAPGYEQVAAVYTDCGSHTHTLMPDLQNKRLLVYVQSYPLGGQGARCNAETHRKISVVEVPLADPSSAKVISTPDVGTAVGCHDTTVLVPKKLAASACITESQIWALGDVEGVSGDEGASPENPKVIARIRNPFIDIHHSATFSWDGRTLVLGAEFAGAAEKSPCAGGGAHHLPLGALWFYDISRPDAPEPRSHYRIPEVPTPRCGAHNFNAVPLSSGRDVLVSAWYEGGTGVIDFTDPNKPTRLGYYIPRAPQAESWSSYWYNGKIFSNNFTNGRGLDVFEFADPAVRGAKKLRRLNPQTQEFLIDKGGKRNDG